MQKRKGLSAYGLFELGKYKFNLVNGLLLGFAFAPLSDMITVWLQWNEFSLAPSLLQIIIQTMIFAAGTLLPSLAEDILTRAYLFAHRPQRLNKNLFALVPALAFVLNHIFRLPHTDVMVYLFILGSLLAWCLDYTRSLWLTFGIHWRSNIAYQFFAKCHYSKTIKEIGYDNFLLAASYLIGWAIIFILYKLQFFKIAHDTAAIKTERSRE